MGRNVKNEITRHSNYPLALREPKRVISEEERGELANLPSPDETAKRPEANPFLLEAEENRPIANLNRLKEFNGLFKSCAKAAQNHKGGRKEGRLNQSAERIRLYLVDSLRKSGVRLDWRCGFSDFQTTWKMLSDRMWTEREHLNVLQIQESVRLATTQLFELPSDGWHELEKAMENLRNLKVDH